MSPEQVLLALRALMAVALYAFLGAILVLLWRDLRAASRAERHVPAARLVVEDGPEAGRAFALTPLNLIGRAADNTLRIQDGTVSAYHARLSYQGGQWWLEDLGSRNGTRVNQIQVQQPLVVTYGDAISLGSVRLLLVAGEG
jgi:hypothetical protein